MRRPKVMGIVNVTPDSFSDGGADCGAAVDLARRLIAEGAEMLDIGGESTRPGAAPVSEAEELDRVLPVIEAVRRSDPLPISIDTMKPAVARAAVAAGASMWNDVTALRFASGSLEAAVDLGCEVALMHMKGDPATMQASPRYDDVLGEVSAFLLARAEAAMAAGIARERIWLDPGIGFGKTVAHNLTLLGGLDRLITLGFPVLVGASRKGFIRALAPGAARPADRLGGSLTVALDAARAGVAMIRVHDVAATVQALDVAMALEAARGQSL